MSTNKTPLLPDDLENELRDYYSSPEPESEFISRLERGLHSKLNEQEKIKMSGKSAKLKWGFGFAFAVVLISFIVTSPTVVAAMKRLLGYIPGVGLVDTVSPLRVLAEPVIQTRDGITVTVEEVVLSSDKTAIVYKIENIPFDKFSHEEDKPGCLESPSVRLPDGSLLVEKGFSGEGWGTGFEYHAWYTAIPADVNEATLLIPCIQDVLPGVLPEDWELPLRFVPAPDSLNALPVIEYTPSPEAVDGITNPNPISVTKVIDTGDYFILTGEFAPPVPENIDENYSPAYNLTLTDGNGQQVFWETPQDIDQSNGSDDDRFKQSWAIQVAKGFVAPLNINFSSQYSHPIVTDAPLKFEFDAGENPQPGDEFQLNKEFIVEGHTFVLNTVAVLSPPQNMTGGGYDFSFTSTDPLISSVYASIDGYTTWGGGGGGGLGSWTTGMFYTDMPKGKLTITLGVDLFTEAQNWTLPWQPEDASSNTSAMTDTLQACLTLDSWQAALASPLPLPAELNGKVMVYGPLDPASEDYEIYTVNLNGSDRHVVGLGVWPSLSPDGTLVAYAWDDGLYLTDLANGESHLIPGALSNDYSPIWSPDGTQIAFIREADIYVTRPDGTDLHRVVDGIDYEHLVGWSPDGVSLYFYVDRQDGALLRVLDIASGTTRDLFKIKASYKSAEFTISPDGNRVAFVEQIKDNTVGLYVSDLDGSNRSLIAQMGHWMTVNTLWSPDGNWLITDVFNTDLPDASLQPTLVNLQDCRIIPLNWSGYSYGWVR